MPATPEHRLTRRSGHLWTLFGECAGNRWLPRIELTAGLEGGGSVVSWTSSLPWIIRSSSSSRSSGRPGERPGVPGGTTGSAEDRCGGPDVDVLVGLLDVFRMAGTTRMGRTTAAPHITPRTHRGDSPLTWCRCG